MKMQSRESQIPGYLYALDGLRAISLILIVTFHTWQQSWISYQYKLPGASHYLFNFDIFQRYGYVAIDSFFVLSGFCLFYPIARDMFGESKFGGWKNFYVKRARRIYPSYLFMLLLLLIFPSLSYATYDTHNVVEVAKQFITHALFIHNISSKTIGSTISTAWTMAIEVQFYIVFPLICIPFRKKPVLTYIAMSITAVIMRLLLLSYTDIGSSQMQALFPTYFDVFGSGMISAYFVVYVRNKLKSISKLKTLMTAISALCLFTAVCYMYWLKNANFPDGFSKDVYFRFLYRGLFAVLLSGFIFTACFSHDVWEKKIWGNRFFVFLSSISYTVYLWHQNIFIFLKKVNLMNASTERVMDDRPAMWRMVLICWSASLIIGWLVTKYIETPVVRYGFKGCADKIISAVSPKQSKNKKHKTSR